MPNQATINGNIEEGEDFSSYSELELIKSALILNNWTIDSHSSFSDGYNTFTISNGNTSLNLHVYLKKVMWRHRNTDEKGIQFSANRITTGYEVVQNSNNITLMLGVYKREIYDDYLVVAWNPFEWGNLGKACNCFINVHALAQAFQIGFSIDNSKLPRKVFSFKPEFIHYYITNKNKLHELDIDLVSNDEGFINTNSSDYTNSNTIYYGAPGTGKSYKVDQIIKDLDKQFYERITFHPEYDNASFIGGYKPISEKDKEGKDVIKYEFVPQAFANIYKRAWQNLDNQYYLVIEEINRGNCAEIFGELFQLLDRNSGYTVAPSNELYKHLVEEFGDENHEGIIKGLKLPPNLAILATMNTSDQSLFPMDSAFKRRWEWEYVPICYDKVNEEDEENKSFNFIIDLGNGSQYSWIDFIKIVNKTHIGPKQNLGMDKCMGNYFVKPENENSISLKQFINKVVFYLWNDVFKDEDNDVFEVNGSYEDFFPISTNGLNKVTELFERIGLEKLVQNLEDETSIDLAAEPQEPYGE